MFFFHTSLLAACARLDSVCIYRFGLLLQMHKLQLYIRQFVHSHSLRYRDFGDSIQHKENSTQQGTETDNTFGNKLYPLGMTYIFKERKPKASYGMIPSLMSSGRSLMWLVNSTILVLVITAGSAILVNTASLVNSAGFVAHALMGLHLRIVTN